MHWPFVVLKCARSGRIVQRIRMPNPVWIRGCLVQGEFSAVCTFNGLVTVHVAEFGLIVKSPSPPVRVLPERTWFRCDPCWWQMTAKGAEIDEEATYLE